MIIALDFDGTLCEHKYPQIGAPREAMIDKVKAAKKNGCKLILWTCREGDKLNEAVVWSKKHGIEFDAVNTNVDEMKFSDLAKHKVYADIYVDDRNVPVEYFEQAVVVMKKERR